MIEEANWLHLDKANIKFPEGGYDAIICMGNSFPHLPDVHGDQTNHYTAIRNFYDRLRPGGILVIDHRNYDHLVSGGKATKTNIYYKVCIFLLLLLIYFYILSLQLTLIKTLKNLRIFL